MVAYIHITNTGTPEEFEAWEAEQSRLAAEDDTEEESEEIAQHMAAIDWAAIDEEIAQGDEDIENHRASQIGPWWGTTAHPDRLSRTFSLPSGGALILSRPVEPGQPFEEAARAADDAWRAEGWDIPVVERYEVVYDEDRHETCW